MPHHKSASQGRPIERAPVPSRIIVPLSQHLGAPCRPVVEKGDAVERGQVVGTVDAMISAPVHSPADGEVTGIVWTLSPAGTRVDAVEIMPAAEQNLGSWQRVKAGETVSDTVRGAGVVGMGGAMFPSSVKLTPPSEFDVRTVILNGCECEPYLTCDHRLMVEQPERVVAGGTRIREAIGGDRLVIGVEDNKPDAIEALREAAGADVEVIALASRYPQGAEKQLIYSVLHEEVPTGKLPAATGALVHNVGTAVAILDALESRKPLIERVVTVTGAVKRPGNYLTLVGTPIDELLEHAGGFDGEVEKVIAGGPMTGFALADLTVPIVKGSSGIVVLRPGESTPVVDGDQPCIRCGRCPVHCPAFLRPYAIASYAREHDWDTTAELHAMDCIECGVCSYVCPTRRPLLQLIRRAKAEIASRGSKS